MILLVCSVTLSLLLAPHGLQPEDLLRRLLYADTLGDGRTGHVRSRSAAEAERGTQSAEEGLIAASVGRFGKKGTTEGSLLNATELVTEVGAFRFASLVDSSLGVVAELLDVRSRLRIVAFPIKRDKSSVAY